MCSPFKSFGLLLLLRLTLALVTSLFSLGSGSCTGWFWCWGCCPPWWSCLAVGGGQGHGSNNQQQIMMARRRCPFIRKTWRQKVVITRGRVEKYWRCRERIDKLNDMSRLKKISVCTDKIFGVKTFCTFKVPLVACPLPLTPLPPSVILCNSYIPDVLDIMSREHTLPNWNHNPNLHSV